MWGLGMGQSQFNQKDPKHQHWKSYLHFWGAMRVEKTYIHKARCLWHRCTCEAHSYVHVLDAVNLEAGERRWGNRWPQALIDSTLTLLWKQHEGTAWKTFTGSLCYECWTSCAHTQGFVCFCIWVLQFDKAWEYIMSWWTDGSHAMKIQARKRRRQSIMLID